MLHVLHLITGLEVGGAETTLARLVAGLDRARFRSTVVSLSPGGALATEIAAAGVPVHSLGMRRGLGSALTGILKLRRLLRALRPDLVQTWLYHADFVGLAAGRLAGVRPIVWNLRCADMDLSRYAATTRLLVRLLARLSPLPDAVIVNADAGRRWHAQLGYRPRRWAVIPNGFDANRFRPDAAARATFRRALGIADGVPVIGTVARFDPMKDPATFVRAAAILGRTRANAHFVMIGRGLDSANPGLAAEVRAAGLGSRLHLMGERRDVAALLPGFDLFALTSFSEGFPNVLGEAMAAALACVATDVGDARLLLSDCGRIVPRADAQAMAAAWDELIESGPAARAALGARARTRIEADFTPAAAVAAYERLYAELAPGRLGGGKPLLAADPAPIIRPAAGDGGRRRDP